MAWRRQSQIEDIGVASEENSGEAQAETGGHLRTTTTTAVTFRRRVGLAFPAALAAHKGRLAREREWCHNRKSRVLTAAGVRPPESTRLVGAVTEGGAVVMAVETLSPDWEFDRVDDGSQSKKRQGKGCGWKVPRRP